MRATDTTTVGVGRSDTDNSRVGSWVVPPVEGDPAGHVQVASSGNDSDIVTHGVRNSGLQGRVGHRGTEGEVQNFRSCVDSGNNALRNSSAGTGTVRAQDANGKDLRIGSQAGDAHCVVVLGGDDSGHMRAVGVQVVPPSGRTGRARDEVESGKDLACEVFMCAVDTGVDDGNGDARTAGELPHVLSLGHGALGVPHRRSPCSVVVQTLIGTGRVVGGGGGKGVRGERGRVTSCVDSDGLGH